MPGLINTLHAIAARQEDARLDAFIQDQEHAIREIQGVLAEAEPSQVAQDVMETYGEILGEVDGNVLGLIQRFRQRNDYPGFVIRIQRMAQQIAEIGAVFNIQALQRESLNPAPVGQAYVMAAAFQPDNDEAPVMEFKRLAP